MSFLNRLPPIKILKRIYSFSYLLNIPSFLIPYYFVIVTVYNGKGETIPVAGHGVPQVCETSKLSRHLDIRLTEGGEIVSLKHRPPFTPKKIACTHFCYRLSRSQ